MNPNPSPLIAISVGEASGDLLGAHLIRAIKARCPNARFTGIGGERMKAEGFESLYDQEKLAVRGFVEVIKRLPQILKIRKGLVSDLIRLKSKNICKSLVWTKIAVASYKSGLI